MISRSEKIGYIVGILFISFATWATFYYASPIKGMAETYIIFFWHVPFNWASTILICSSAYLGFKYVKSMETHYALKSFAMNCVGFVFCLFGNISGLMWAKLEWGGIGIDSLDPKFLSAVFSLFLYSSYFIFRNSIQEVDSKFRLSSLYVIISTPFMIFFSFVLPRMKWSLHPNNPIANKAFGVENGITLAASLIATTILAFLIYKLRYRIEAVHYQIEEKHHG